MVQRYERHKNQMKGCVTGVLQATNEVETKSTYHIVENICQCPGHCNREEWQTQKHVVKKGHYQYVCDPHAFAIEIC